MNKHNFKIGDKVKLKPPWRFSCGGKVLTVVDIDCGYKYIPVRWEGMKGVCFPLLPDEIEPVIKVGEQLTFEFMQQG